MSDILYIVDEIEFPIVIAAIIKNDSGRYTYIPINVRKDSPFPSSLKISSKVPTMISSRTYSPKRSDINKILSRYGLSHYDAWELVKRAEGSLATDKFKFLTIEGIKKYNITLPDIQILKKLKLFRKIIRF